MVYCETIEESKTWVCPKTGVWKIICIGGGGAGNICSKAPTSTSNKFISYSGGVTSFGNYVSADGGVTSANFKYAVIPLPTQYEPRTYFGINGFNGCAEYGSASNTYIGSGYGASGGVCINASNVGGAPGLPGKVVSSIVDIEEGTSVICTVGDGGNVKYTEDDTTPNTDSAAPFSGAKGAIIVQYLGSEM